MPTYEYRCEACANEWELEQRITEEPLRECPKCGAPEAKRLIGAGNFILKGGGWYADLYSSTPKDKKKDAGEKKADTKTEAKSEKKSETKSSETKPAKKASSSD